jgi:hypothetical protein
LSSLFYKGKFTTIPDTWNDLSASQYVQAIDVLVLQQADKTTKQIKLLKILAGWSWWRFVQAMGWLRWNPMRLIRTRVSTASLSTLEDMSRSLSRTERLSFAAEELTAFLFEKIELSTNLIPVVYPGGSPLPWRGRGGFAFFNKGVPLHGPAPELANLVMAEFCYSEHYFNQWKEKKDIVLLNQLISILYRPSVEASASTGFFRRSSASTTADPRIPFDPNICNTLVKQIERWPLALRIAIGTMYGSMRQQKIEENPRVFSDGGSDGEANLYGLWSIMRQVAKAGHLGKLKDIETTYVDTVLMELNESLVEAERQEAELEKMKAS